MPSASPPPRPCAGGCSRSGRRGCGPGHLRSASGSWVWGSARSTRWSSSRRRWSSGSPTSEATGTRRSTSSSTCSAAVRWRYGQGGGRWWLRMLLRDEREALCAHARRMRAEGLAEGTSGNLSVRTGDLVAVTPSGVPYEQLDAAAICLVGLDGRQVDGVGAPSTELPMHLAVYRSTSAAAVVHTHSAWATAVSMVTDELPAAHYMLAFVGGAVRVAPYATPGTEELGERMLAALDDRSAVLL